MKLNFGGLPLDDVLSNKSLQESLESDLTELDNKVALLESLMVYDGTEPGLEGIVKDVVKTVAYTAPKKAAQTGAKIYKETNKKHQQMKAKWNKTIKPLILKTLKEIGNTLQNMYFKFSKFEKKYAELGKKIDYVLKHQLQQIGTLHKGTIFIHDFEPNVFKGYTVMMNDYSEFYKSTIEVMVDNNLESKDLASAISRKDLRKVRACNESYTNALGKINEYGEITIPWAVYKDKRYSTFFKAIFSRKPTKDDMKSSLSDFVKRSILSKELKYEFDINERDEFIGLAGGYLKVMSSVLNNRVIDKALKGGGDSLKKQTKEFYKEIEGLSKLSVEPPKKDKDDESDEMSKEDMINQELETYITNSLSVLTKTSTAYTGIVRGTLSALFTLVNETEELCSIIEASAGTKGGKK